MSFLEDNVSRIVGIVVRSRGWWDGGDIGIGGIARVGPIGESQGLLSDSALCFGSGLQGRI